MRERPIMFKGPMVRAILEGRKTQTRRTQGLDAVNAWPDDYRLLGFEDGRWHFAHGLHSDGDLSIKCPHGQPGDRLWVKETFCAFDVGRVHYRADFTPGDEDNVWTPSIFMPRHASRILLEITDVRVQRLQDISDADAWAEGVQDFVDSGPTTGDGTARGEFAALWDSINRKTHPWASNPWVWAITFKALDK